MAALPPVYPYDLRIAPPVQPWQDDRILFLQPRESSGTQMTISDLQHQFLTGELGLLSINAALATRNAGWPVYARSKTAHQRTDAKNAVRRVLKQVESHYSNGGSQA